MLLPAGLIAVLLLGLFSLGGPVASALARQTGLPELATLPLTYLAFIAPLGGAIYALRKYTYRDHPPHEDAPWETGVARGQSLLFVMLTVTIGFVLAVCIVYTPFGKIGLLVALAATVLVFPSPAIVRSKWPPPLPKYDPQVPPARSDSPGSQTDKEPLPEQQMVTRHYTWRFIGSLGGPHETGVTCSLELTVRPGAYERFRNIPRAEPTDDPVGRGVYARYVREGTTAEVRRCARLLREKGVQLGLGYFDFVNFVLSFTTGAFDYVSDEQTHGVRQYTNYPLETLYEQRGDCEDFAILAASLLHEMGFDVILWIIIFRTGPGHAALGVRSIMEIPGLRPPLDVEGKRYYYCEATPAGTWHFGQISDEFTKNVARSIPIRLDSDA